MTFEQYFDMSTRLAFVKVIAYTELYTTIDLSTT